MEDENVATTCRESENDVVDEAEDYDDDDEGSAELESDVQLGFVEKDDRNVLFRDPDWRNWDGGTVGGRPIWLNPAEIPETKALMCTQCSDPLKFILQIYCPIDEVSGAFHRAIYLFCCKNRQCLNAGSVKCYRVQLPRANKFYCFEPADAASATGTNAESTSAAPLPTLCALCGCRGSLLCGQCKGAHYCSKAHQKEHWKCHKLLCSQTKPAERSTILEAQMRAAEEQVLSRHLFPELGLVVEAEVFEGQDEAEMKSIMEKANIWEDAVTEGGADEAADAKLTQADYQKALGSEVHDPTYINFLTRVERGGGDQVLRYCRTSAAPASLDANSTSGNATKSCGGRSTQGLLLLSSNPQLLKDRTATIQSNPCPRCGAPRTFECQVMPQLLHFLKVDQHTRLAEVEAPANIDAEKEQAGAGEQAAGEDGNAAQPSPIPPEKAFYNKSDKDIDWGSLDIFTCSASCDAVGGAGAYAEELVLIQPPVYYNK